MKLMILAYVNLATRYWPAWILAGLLMITHSPPRWG